MGTLIRYAQFSGECENYQYQLNSFHRDYVRRVEKNRFPAKCKCAICGEPFLCKSIDEYMRRGNVCRGCDLKNRVQKAAGVLYELIKAIPQTERDLSGISPAEFEKAIIPRAWREYRERRASGSPIKPLAQAR